LQDESHDPGHVHFVSQNTCFFDVRTRGPNIGAGKLRGLPVIENYCLVVWNIFHYFSHHIGNVIIPTDFHSLHHFSEGWQKTNQMITTTISFQKHWE